MQVSSLTGVQSESLDHNQSESVVHTEPIRPAAQPPQRATVGPRLRMSAGRAGLRQGEASRSMLARASLVVADPVLLFQRRYETAKRLLDIAVCLLILLPSLAVMSVCALLIWLDNPGPILFCQRRTGRGGRRFRMYKFRTMRTDAEALKAKYAHLNELSWPDFKITNDPRMTRAGRWLRKTSLDELPQLFNVLKGDMSLVGPRPTSFDVSTYSLHHTERLEVTPGITGLWQISGRAELDFDQRLALDVAYIERRSLWLDLSILARTITSVAQQRGAY